MKASENKLFLEQYLRYICKTKLWFGYVWKYVEKRKKIEKNWRQRFVRIVKITFWLLALIVRRTFCLVESLFTLWRRRFDWLNFCLYCQEDILTSWSFVFIVRRTHWLVEFSFTMRRRHSNWLNLCLHCKEQFLIDWIFVYIAKRSPLILFLHFAIFYFIFIY